MQIWLPDVNYFKLTDEKGPGLPSIPHPLQCVFILPASLQTCLGQFENYTTHLTKVYPPERLHRGTPSRFKFDSKLIAF